MTGIIETFFLAMTPIGELRASIPIGLVVYHLPWYLVFFVSVIGNLIPVVLLLLFLEPLSKRLSSECVFFEKFFNWLFKRTRKNTEKKMSKYGYLSLVLFVAIPLPITGAWTGSIMAFLFKIPFKKAFPLIALGVLMAGIIVLSLTSLGFAVEKYLGFEVLLALFAVILSFYFIFKKKNV